MQNIGNNVEFGAVKEKYMSPLNVVLQRNRDKMNDFLDEMTNVEDFNPLSSGVCFLYFHSLSPFVLLLMIKL